MDELSAFKFAPSDLRDNEKKLLKVADLVFTGGRSLYHSKIKQADSVYCYPSSVEVKHFQKARTSHFKRPSDLVKISKPIVGFYGVVDERIDLDLIAYTATCLPNVSFVVIGPVVKIDVNTLPQNHNIHYLGPKAYETLPRYLKYFDAAMMPFALNIHTKYISPTKTLEFLASGTPTISTPIKDVVTDYSSIVAIAYNRNEFVTAISNTLNLDTKFYYDWLKQVDKVISKTSWDRTVKSMEKNINQTLQTKVLQEASLSRLIKTNLASHLGVIYEASS
jgi:glycosyltransferase involved in cell wall biosynthesis